MVKAHESFIDRVLKLLNRVADIIAFKGLTIRWRFTLFFFGTLFWFIVIASISIVTTRIESSYYKGLEAIANYDNAGQRVIRKLRGASISAHKVVIYNDIYVISQHAERGRARLDDAGAFIQTLLKGGVLRDYSKAIEHLFDEFLVKPVQGSERKRLLIEAMGKVEKLREAFDRLIMVKLNGKRGEITNTKLLGGLREVDTITMETIIVMGNFSSANTKLIHDNKHKINRLQYISIIAIALSLLTATSLLLIFLIRLSRSMTKPIKTMTGHIKDISAGGVITSQRHTRMAEKDEMGELFHQFEGLVEWFTEINSYKKVIEEDYTVEDVYFRLADVFKRQIGLDNFLIYEVSNSKNTMKVVYPLGSAGSGIYCNRDTQIDCNLCRAKKTGHIISSLEYPDICRQFLYDKEKEYACVPLIMGGSTGGAVQFVFDKHEGGFSREAVDKKVSKARQYIDAALPVIEAKRLQSVLRESSLRDTLTGLHNRRFLEEYVETIVSGVLRKKTLLGLLTCDVDFFKEVNDSYGHDVGDMVLREAANIIKGNVRDSDMVVRFGGEEFLVILMDVREGEAQGVAEKIRSQMEDAKIKIAGGLIQKTISIGISEFPKDTEQFWEAIKFSDVALYKAKETDRNRVVRFTQEMLAEEKY